MSGAYGADAAAPHAKPVVLITDGACLGNPGKGGWAFILRYNHHMLEAFGAEPHTTNNRMELTAVIEGLRRLTRPCQVEIITDSQYVKNGMMEWIRNWKRNGWRTAAKKPVLNQELWQALDQLVSKHTVAWTWTKGHASHVDNNRCDELATQAAREQISSDAR